jgi:hypothetical protein
MRFRICSLFSLVDNGWMVNLRPDRALRWEAEGHQLGRPGRVLGQADTSKVVTPACVS